MHNPCHGCIPPKRFPGCQVNCPDPKAYQEDCRKRKQFVRDMNFEPRGAYISECMTRNLAWKKRGLR